MIEVTHLQKHFRKPIRGKGLGGMFLSLFSRKHTVIKAVDDVSFTINDGESVGYIGANGAGKSTTIKMMSGIITPTSGEILIEGMRPYVSSERKKVLKQIGVVFGQKTQLWYDLPLTETYDLLRHIYEIPENEYKERLAYLTEVLGLTPFISSPVRTLSLGQRMRADIAASMLHNPKLLFLDEPTIGLDVLVKHKLIKAIRDIRKQYNTTLILTTHAMSDIEDLCERVILLDEGKIIYDGKLTDLKRTFGDRRTVRLQTETPIDCDALSSEFSGITKAYIDDEGTAVITIDAKTLSVSEFLSYAFDHFKILDVKLSETSIEQIVGKIYKDKVV